MARSLDQLLPKLVLAPAFVLGLAFIYGFMVWNGLLSVTASRMLPNYEWVGLAQYTRLWEMDRWSVALKNLAIFGLLYVGVSMALGVFLAVLLDQKVRGEGFIRTVYLYPMALSFVVTGKARAAIRRRAASCSPMALACNSRTPTRWSISAGFCRPISIPTTT